MRPYGYQWRTTTRPAILARDGYRCQRCMWGTRLEVAHLDGDNLHDENVNLATLCAACHRRFDYPVWLAKSKATRSMRKDQARPLLLLVTL